jgi:hypothetical protein
MTYRDAVKEFKRSYIGLYINEVDYWTAQQALGVLYRLIMQGWRDNGKTVVKLGNTIPIWETTTETEDNYHIVCASIKGWQGDITLCHP